MNKRFNKNGYVTYIKNEYNKVIRVRYYKHEIVMYFEVGIVYRYMFKNGVCLENKYINGTLIGCTIYEGKTKEMIIQEIQESHGKPTRAEKQKSFIQSIKRFFESI
ncbi:hypothetical protein [Flavobacterium sp. ABG]|uniref:hypothetical protein n=1 Tax=Flavobacterium sp. ABG TaxID=1423322 RepID=UPI000A4C2EFE|nr:hypothetical protein [Flavobacterium sp. ABG]